MATSSSGPSSLIRSSPVEITSGEINVLIHAYLVESGLSHSAFAFSNETELSSLSSDLLAHKIPRGELIRWLHRGLLWKEVETHVGEDTPLPVCSAPFTLLEPHRCASIPPAETVSKFSSRPTTASKSDRISSASAAATDEDVPPLAATSVTATSNAKGKRKAAALPVSEGEEEMPEKPVSSTSNGSTTKRSKVETADEALSTTSGKNGKATSKNLLPLPAIQRKSNSPSNVASTSSSVASKTDKSSLPSQSKPNSPSTSTVALPNLSSSTKPSRSSQSSQSNSPNPPPSQALPSIPSSFTTKPTSSVSATSTTTASKTNAAADAEAKAKKKPGLVPKSEVAGMGEDFSKTLHKKVQKFKDKDVKRWTDHTGELFVVKFSPVQDGAMATGAGDATVRLWEFDPSEGWSLGKPPTQCRHVPVVTDRKDITSIDFSPTGSLLGSASYDGVARLWTAEGELHGVLTRHSGAIFCLRFNPAGNLLATAGADGSVCVWDAASSKLRQVFLFHSATECCLDIDWADNETLASCSADKTVNVCRVGYSTPVKTLRGHQDEVNICHFQPAPPGTPLSGRTLASCSDDATVRFWTMGDDEGDREGDDGLDRLERERGKGGKLEKWCKGVLRGHKKEIYTFEFDKNRPYDSPRLATASFDCTVRLWDVNTFTCLRVLRAHSESVFALSFSPTGRHLATAGWDKNLVVWETESGLPVRHLAATGGIFELEWHSSGSVIALGQSDRALVLVGVEDLED